jgi:sugar phosphate isomerase/epimerase
VKILNDPPVHLTYCLNVHPGESRKQIIEAINAVSLDVRERLIPTRPFGLGLRLGHLAANDLSSPETLNHFKAFLETNRLYVFTINGFAYGQFHNIPVKTDVYTPDWRSPKRLGYTIQLANILNQLIPEGVSGSISTVPGSYKAWIRKDADRAQIIRNLMRCVAHLNHLHEETGKEIHLGLEPEPDCFLETTGETVRFFNHDLYGPGLKYLARLVQTSETKAAEMIGRHLGVCFDTCHMAVQFEDLLKSIALLTAHHIRLSKIQISAALRIFRSRESLKRLENFCDPVYLHQVKRRVTGQEITGHEDLTTALLSMDMREHAEEEWRIHFHVPLYFPGDEDLCSTNVYLTRDLFEAVVALGCNHLEIETYTFQACPENVKKENMVKSIAREYEWVLGRMPVQDLPAHFRSNNRRSPVSFREYHHPKTDVSADI